VWTSEKIALVSCGFAVAAQFKKRNIYIIAIAEVFSSNSGFAIWGNK
jgi:hypothetical protein